MTYSSMYARQLLLINASTFSYIKLCEVCVLSTSLLGCVVVRSDEWSALDDSKKEELGLTLENDGEFW